MAQKEMPARAGNGKAPVVPKRPLPTDRVAVPKQLEILRAWAAGTNAGLKPATAEQIADIVKVAASTVKMLNAFFTDNGILQRVDGGLLPCPEVVSFNHTHQWTPETAQTKLAPVVEATWFSSALLPRLSFGPIKREEAVAVLSEAVSAGKDYEGQLGVIIEFMETVGTIVKENGSIRAAAPMHSRNGCPPVVPATTTTMPVPVPSEVKEVPQFRALSPVSTGFSKEGMLNFHVSFRVDM